MAIRELTPEKIRNQYANEDLLKTAFQKIKNATLVKSSDSHVIILDEENQQFYEVDYRIDHDLDTLHLNNFSPIVLKEETIDAKSMFVRAMSESTEDQEQINIARQLARHYTRQYLGGERERLIRESRLKGGSKRIDRGRRSILEDMNLFKTENRQLISEIKNSGFFAQFCERFNGKYMSEQATAIIDDRINFHLIEQRTSGKENHDTVMIKRLNEDRAIPQTGYNAMDVMKNSPSFGEKLDKFMESVWVLNRSDRDKDLSESTKHFIQFTNNWPIMYLVNESTHKDFALKRFANAGSVEKARATIDAYVALISSKEFKENQSKFLEENYGTPSLTESKKDLKLNESIYTARLVDESKNAIKKLRENVARIESFNVSNYLGFAEEQFDKMLRAGKFDEELFEQVITDVFGDSRMVTIHPDNDVFDDPDFRETLEESASEEDLKQYELEAQAHRLIVELRDMIPRSDRSLKLALNEELDLVKSMTAIHQYDEERLNQIQSMIDEIYKEKESKPVQEAVHVAAFCPSCNRDVAKPLTEARLKKHNEFSCPGCGSKLKA